MRRKCCTILGYSLLLIVAVSLGFFAKKNFNDRYKPASADFHTSEYNKNQVGDAGSPDVEFGSQSEGVVVWHQKIKGEYNIYGQRMDKSGNKIGEIFQVNQYLPNDQKFPKVSMSRNGNFIVIWQSFGQDGDGSGIFGQRFKANGLKNGNEFRANTYIANSQLMPDIAMKDDGSFVVVWVSEKQDKTLKSIYLKLFNSENTPMSDEMRVNTNNKSTQTAPVVAINSTGQIIVVWQSNANLNWDIYAQAITQQNQTFLKNDLLVHSADQDNQIQPAITTTGSSDFMVAWAHEEPFYSLPGTLKEQIKIQKISGQGTKKGSAYSLQPSLGHQEFPSINSLNNKTSLAWQAFKKGEWQLNVQDVNSSGSPSNQLTVLNCNFKITVITNSHTKSDQDIRSEYKSDSREYKKVLRNNQLEASTEHNLRPSIALDSSGNRNVVWEFSNDPLEKKVILYKQIDKLTNPIILSISAETVDENWMLSRIQLSIEKIFWFIKGFEIVEEDKPEVAQPAHSTAPVAEPTPPSAPTPTPTPTQITQPTSPTPLSVDPTVEPPTSPPFPTFSRPNLDKIRRRF